ncbi:uncharacterized protein LOC126900458 [Daktulosphaira vitifoliae]|uniref:uncharacterized protein LOC126900458 n=1 Tax=Daktulosphaira vitifoliae TaxID=58002 RepID=UPI0021A9C35D|nr:uncharacterized protein LOC126900458 [Daktulosphaira vitifoliae]
MASKSVLDLFEKVIKAPQNGKPKLCMQLVKHLQLLSVNELDEHQQKEVFYVLTRLVRGLGSPKTQVRTVYYSILVVIINYLSDKEWFKFENFKDIVDKELSKYDSKAEEGDVLSGKVLCYGATIRSGLFGSSSTETQKFIVTELLNNTKTRSYLPLLTYKFLIEGIDSSNNVMFAEIIWPLLKKYIGLPLVKQNLDLLYCILQVHKQYPSLINGTFIPRVFDTATELLCNDSMNDIAKILITSVSSMDVLEHPIYDSFANALTSNDNSDSLLKSFWSVLQPHFTGSHNRYQEMAAMKLFTNFIKSCSLTSLLPLLSDWFLDMLIKSFSRSNADALILYARKSITAVIERISSSNVAEIAYKTLLKFIMPPGDMMIEKITNIKIVQNCLLNMNEEYIKLLANQCQLVILMKGNNGKAHFWKVQDRGYAAQLLSRLLGLQNCSDISWKIEQMKFMLENAFFTSANDKNYISHELSVIIRDSFLKALSHKQPNLNSLRITLSTLVQYADELLKSNHTLRPKTSKEDLSVWKLVLKTTKEIEKKLKKCESKSKEESILFVFHTMFLQMGLYLFVEPVIAKDTLEELKSCYEHHKTEKSDETEDEPHWVEVVVELMLSLLAKESYLLRQLITRIFSHLCSELTPQASHQILQVLNPEYDTVTNSMNENSDDETESESDEENNENDEEKEEENYVKVNGNKINGHCEDDDESDCSEIEEELSDEDQDNTEQLKLALHKAMMSANQHSDDESVDIDDMTEEEGKMMDDLLSEAFKNFKKNSSKNPKHIKEKMNFRLRVLDLVDIYLENSPSLSLVIDTIPTLFALLEYCIKDVQQRPLETRVRSILKKISQLKKIDNTESVDEDIISTVLKVLMDKGVRTTPVFLDISVHITQCCTFLVKSYVYMLLKKSIKKQKSSKIISILESSLNDFFTKRDCLLPVTLFQSLLSKVSWDRNIHLLECILPFAFSNTVRWFRRSQAVCIIVSFYHNTRHLEQLKNKSKLDQIERNLSDNIINFFTSLDDSQPDISGRQRYINELLNILCVISSNKFSNHCCDWEQLMNILENSKYRYNQAGRKILNKLKQSVLKINDFKSKNENDNLETTINKIPVKRKSLLLSNKKVKKIKNI